MPDLRFKKNRRNIKVDRTLILDLNRPINITASPFRTLAGNLGIKEDNLLSILKDLRKTGIIRRFGAVLNHNKIGYKNNALIAWRVRKKNINRAAGFFSSMPEITHCYLRSTAANWPYNLYTMLHISGKAKAQDMVNRISEKVKIKDYRILLTLKEFKKTKTNLESILIQTQ